MADLPQRSPADAFDALTLGLDASPASPLPRHVLHALLALLALILIAVAVGRVDVVAVAEGRLVPRTLLRIVQPAEAGIVRDILVEEGAMVLAGQPLLRLDARVAEADLRMLRHAAAIHDLQLRRIDAELGIAPLARQAGDPLEAFEQAQAQYRANRAAHDDAAAQAASAVARARQELASAREVERKLARTVPMLQTVAARFDRLRAEGFVSELAALDRDRERVEREQDLAAQAHAVRALEASLAQAERQLVAIGSGQRRTLAAERAEAAAQRARIREEIDKQLVRREQVELVAPEAGIVKEIATRTVGSVVAAGTVLVTMVPAGDALEAEVHVRNDDAGFVRPGQRAAVKVVGYPFQKYGLLDAQVGRVAADASDPPAAPRAATDGDASGGYRARLALASQSLPFDGVRLPLVPGMAVSAEIHLGRRALLDYLLAPVQKAWHEAARER